MRSVPGPRAAACALLLALLVFASPASAEIGGGTTASAQAGAAKIASSTNGSCALTPQTTLHCWGDGYSGQLATGSEDDIGAAAGTSTVQVFLDRSVVPAQVSSGYAHSCAVDTTGGVWCWGRNIHGQVGDGSSGEYLGDDAGERPYRVVLPGGQAARQVAAGREHTCAILADRSVACWGANETGQLGLGTLDDGVHLPAVVNLGGESAFGLATRNNHTCIVTTTRKIRCWGANERGQTGVANGVGAAPVTTPAAPNVISGAANFLGISVGGQFACAITAPVGEVVCWGENDSGQLATGTETSTTAPGSVAATINLGGAKAVAISTGDDSVCALTDAGAVRCWGSNSSGHLGGGFVGNDWGDSGGAASPERQPITVALGAGRSAVGLGVGGDHTCVLLTTGAPLCFGEGGEGQRANGSGGDSGAATPATLPPVVFGADWPDGDADGLPDRYDGCPAASAQTADGCPPPAQPLPQPQPPAAQQPKPPGSPTSPTPARKLKIAVTLKLKGKAKSCPKAGTASVVKAKPAFSRSVQVKKAKVKGKTRCAATATLTWAAAPAPGTKVKVKVGGKGLTSRTITVKVTT